MVKFKSVFLEIFAAAERVFNIIQNRKISAYFKYRIDYSTRAYISFCAYVSQDFEGFLLPFQGESPMIHLLYPEMCKLLVNLMRKFIKNKRMENPPDSGIHTMDLSKERNHKPLNLIDIGTKAKVLFSGVAFLPSERQAKFRQDCLNFYVTSAQYLQIQLPLDNLVIQHAQYLHPLKRDDAASRSAIANLVLKVAETLQRRLASVFGVKESDATVEGVCDLVRTQWLVYQTENIPEEFYIAPAAPTPSSTRVQQSYWDYALDMCCMKTPSSYKSLYVRIDECWSKIGKLVDDRGSMKYPQLYALVKCVLSLSHGNAVPERGFSVNKILLEAHGYTIENSTITAVRLVKDRIRREGDVTKFLITPKVITYAQNSHAKYIAHRDAMKAQKDREEVLQAQKADAEQKRNEWGILNSKIDKI